MGKSFQNPHLYNKTTKASAENLTVERLNNFDVNVTINEGQAGENTTVIVSVTPGVGGNVSANVYKPAVAFLSGGIIGASVSVLFFNLFGE